MKSNLFILLMLFLFLTAGISLAEETPSGDFGPGNGMGQGKGMGMGQGWRMHHGGPEMRGRCGKMLNDCYGARKPVRGAAEAKVQLEKFFEGEDVSVTNLLEKRWGYEATILDNKSKVIDRVMIDKRSGRIRSIY